MSESWGHQFKNDKRIKQAKELIESARAEYAAKITGPRTPQSNLVTSYDEILKKCGQLRGGHLYYPYLSSGLGHGALVELIDGSVKYDFITGIGVHYFGHSHPAILSSGIDAAMEDTVMMGNLQQSESTVKLLDLIMTAVKSRGTKLEHAFLSSSGAMANENAFKIAFQKHAPADRVLAFQHCFAGRTMVMAQVTDKEANRVGLPKVLNVDYVPFFCSGDPAESTKKSLEVLKAHLSKNPGQYAAMIMELVQGEGGYYPGQKEFFIELIKVLKQNNIAVIIDEIQTLGRTDTLFAFQHFGLDDYVDIVTFGKMSQICATVYSPEYKPKPGLISQTFTSSASAIHAGIVTFQELSKPEYWGEEGKVMSLGNYFAQRLEDLHQKMPDKIYGPYGFGCMVAMTVLDGSMDKSVEVIRKLYDAGVISFIAGREPVRIRFLIPVISVTVKDIDAVTKIISQVLEDCSC